MSKFIIEGGKHLKGEVEIKGMKNAITPIIAATLLTDETCIIDNVPKISDVDKMIDILKSLSSEISWTGDQQLTICNKNISLKTLDQKAVKSLRSSILFLGPLLARFGKVDLPEPGGCIIGKRPIDVHLSALKSLGAQIIEDNGFYHLQADKLIGSKIILPEFSVTATENILMAAVKAQGQTIIKLAAQEPHVQDLCNFLNKMGAKISGIGTHTLIIDGVDKLKGAQYKIIPDQIEIGTFIVLAAVTHSELHIKNIIPEHLDLILLKLTEIGVKFELKENQLDIYPSYNLKAFKLQALPYPGFPTDLQAPFALLATQCNGVSLIQDPLYESRMSYVGELIKMGANAIVADPHRIIISGPTPLYGQEIKSFDLRAGATLIIAGLLAEGQTIINQVEIVDRGYEKIEERLSHLGAEIKRAEN